MTAVLNTFKDSGPYPRHSNIIAEWTGNDFYTFDMTFLDPSNAYGTIVDLLNNMSYTNYNFKYKNGTLFLYNLLRDVGSNGNYYMILNDSVQICWGIKDYTITEWYQWASAMFEGYPGTTITFAKQFDGVPSIFLSGRTSQNAGCGVEYISVNSTDITGVYILRPSTGNVNAVGYVNYLAIGKPI